MSNSPEIKRPSLERLKETDPELVYIEEDGTPYFDCPWITCPVGRVPFAQALIVCGVYGCDNCRAEIEEFYSDGTVHPHSPGFAEYCAKVAQEMLP